MPDHLSNCQHNQIYFKTHTYNIVHNVHGNVQKESVNFLLQILREL